MMASPENHATSAPLPWHHREWALFGELMASGQLPHAVMLCGDSEIGKRQFAWALTQKVLCAQPVNGLACGRCKQCLLMVKGTHPDYFPIEPVEPGKAILVDAIRALAEFTGKTAQQGAWRVIVVNPAETMNANSANAFLKTLEEPGPKTLLLLVSHRPGQVLATIRSRCRLVRFAAPAPELALPWLVEQTAGRTDVAAWLAAANGRPLRALRLMTSELHAQLTDFDSWLNEIADGSTHPLQVAERCAKLPWEETIPRLQQRVARALRGEAECGRIPARPPFVFLDRLTTATRWLLESPNINRQLLWEELLLDWRRLCQAGHSQHGYGSLFQ